VRVVDSAGRPVEPAQLDVTWDQSAAERGGYDHFVRKEIEEQPEAVGAALLGRASDSGFTLPELDAIDLAPIRRTYLVAAGSSSYAAMGAKQLLEQWARLPAEVAIASEFRYSSPILGPDTLVVLITQSGETADTMAALRLARANGSPTLAITNVVGSSVARGADSTLYLHVGPEIGVVATKSFTGQVTLLTAIAADIARRRGQLAQPDVETIARDLLAAPDAIRRTLELDGQCTVIAHALARAASVYFIGRGSLYPIAMEAALKLKEITYIPAEGFPAGELKHGPIALLEPGSPVVAFTGTGVTRDKTLSNMAEVRARGAHVIAISPEHDEEVARASDEMIPLPTVSDTLLPIVSVIPAQMLAYHAAVELGRDVDQPRNLAKSVTVE
jgi:glucosamine--fructose-6-phosphate aminotransferase (isomerizing)